MRQILITGAFGFVGSRLAAHFLANGWQVRLFDLPNHARKAELMPWLQEFGTPRLFEGDICDQSALEAATIGCNEVIHAAALLNSIAPKAVFERVNVTGTHTVAEACIRMKVKHLTLISTSDVFGIPRPDQILHEESPYQPWAEPYADTKIEAARLVRNFRKNGDLKASIVYPGWVYGPGDRQFFPAVMDMVRSGTVFTWHRSQPMDVYLVYIDDLIRGVHQIINTPASHNRDYLLLDANSGMTPMDLFSAIADFQGRSIRQVHLPYSLMMFLAKVTQQGARYRLLPAPLLSSTDVKAFGNLFRFSAVRAARELGWTPGMSAEEGVRRALQWQSDNPPQRDL